MVVSAFAGGGAVSALGLQYFDDVGTTLNNCDVLDWWGKNPDCASKSARLKATNTDKVPEGITTVRVYFNNVPNLASGTRTDGTPRPDASNLKFTIQGAYFCPDYIGASGANNRDNLIGGYFATNPGQLNVGDQVTQFKILQYDQTFRPSDIGGAGEYRVGASQCDVTGSNYSQLVDVQSDDLQRQPGFSSDTYYVEVVVQPYVTGALRPAGTYVGGYFQGNGCTKAATNKCSGVANSFRVILDGTRPAVETNHHLIISTGSKATGQAQDYNVTIQNGNPALDPSGGNTAQINDTSRHSGYAVRFGADCNVAIRPAGLVRRVMMYDVDHTNNSHGNANNPGDKVQAILLRIDGLGQAYRLSYNIAGSVGYDESPNPTTPGNWIPVAGGINYVPDYFGDAIPIAAKNGAYQGLKFTAFPNDKYIVFVLDVRSNLVNQYGLPFDGIYYTQPCPPPSGVLSPTADIGPDPLEPGSTALADASIENSSGSAGTTDWTRSFWYRNASDATSPYNAGLGDVTALAIQTGSGTYAAGSNPLPQQSIPNVNGNYQYLCTSLQLSNPGVGTTLGTPNPAVACAKMSKKPYFQVMKGDANTVALMAPCSGTATGTISAFNSGAALAYKGSGSEVAAFAAGAIAEFTSGGAAKPKGLTFANTGTTGTWGGGFTQAYCIPDTYWSGPAVASPIAGESNVNNQAVKYVNGDVYISGDITYAATFNLNSIPFRRISAEGNIYISNTVARLDGVYAAKGNIYTCATGVGAPVDTSQMAALCDKQLVVNGAFIAGGSVKLQRTYQSLAGDPAELFIYSPESWLQAVMPATVPGLPDTTKYKVDSITTLPPIL